MDVSDNGYDDDKTKEEQDNQVIEQSPEESPINIKDLYEKLYSVMKVNISSEVLSDLIPDGWYSVLSEDGLDINISVLKDQLLGYQLLEASIPWIQTSKPNVQYMCDRFFEDSYVPPLSSDLEIIVEYIIDNGVMPEYYTFKERDKIDPEAIAQNMIAISEKKDTQLYWLESYYKNHDIVRQIYKTFLAFRKSVMDTLDKPHEADAKFINDLEEFMIMPDSHNLFLLYDQVIQQYTDLGNLHVNSINWSKRVVKSWFGICYKLPNNTYTIFINRLLCSPLVSEEAIRYVMYHELLHASGLWNHDDKFRNNEWKYPNSDELDGELDEIVLKYKFDYKMLKKYKFNDSQLTEIKPLQNLKVEANNTQSATVNLARTHKFCRSCGNKLPIEAKFCDVCGASTIEY